PHALAGGCGSHDAGARQVARWLADHAGRDDRGVAVYGAADDLLGSGLRLPYPYLWSLPVRTLDPHLARLRATVTGPDRVEWVVVALPLDAWRLDASGALARQLHTAYRPAAVVCGRAVLHRSG
ncbi:MAG: hypothetical protein JWN17_2180, partial [Frankiales bacterium]|nr:hypothetical protein [Frankiales bacterium]